MVERRVSGLTLFSCFLTRPSGAILDKPQAPPVFTKTRTMSTSSDTRHPVRTADRVRSDPLVPPKPHLSERPAGHLPPKPSIAAKPPLPPAPSVPRAPGGPGTALGPPGPPQGLSGSSAPPSTPRGAAQAEGQTPRGPSTQFQEGPLQTEGPPWAPGPRLGPSVSPRRAPPVHDRSEKAQSATDGGRAVSVHEDTLAMTQAGEVQGSKRVQGGAGGREEEPGDGRAAEGRRHGDTETPAGETQPKAPFKAPPTATTPGHKEPRPLPLFITPAAQGNPAPSVSPSPSTTPRTTERSALSPPSGEPPSTAAGRAAATALGNSTTQGEEEEEEEKEEEKEEEEEEETQGKQRGEERLSSRPTAKAQPPGLRTEAALPAAEE
ncbi:hypothetical protein NHX12_003598 [Muraenolepis orangiensis]|uniref:Uncharacterized protein n=1 Tax=Muraenolepis orangiensis TaxID=630683 RepID=A0A9Q0E133_9TELE|nr:hypothetical protein NHX12_003598 [Muraenolepis orangiensis]